MKATLAIPMFLFSIASFGAHLCIESFDIFRGVPKLKNARPILSDSSVYSQIFRNTVPVEVRTLDKERGLFSFLYELTPQVGIPFIFFAADPVSPESDIHARYGLNAWPTYKRKWLYQNLYSVFVKLPSLELINHQLGKRVFILLDVDGPLIDHQDYILLLAHGYVGLQKTYLNHDLDHLTGALILVESPVWPVLQKVLTKSLVIQGLQGEKFANARLLADESQKIIGDLFESYTQSLSILSRRGPKTSDAEKMKNDKRANEVISSFMQLLIDYDRRLDLKTGHQD